MSQAALLLVVLLLSTSSLFALPAADAQGSGGLSKTIFVDLVNGFGFAIVDGVVVSHPSGTCYSYFGIHWASDMIPVGYSPEFGPEAPADAGNAIDAGFAAWNDAGTVFSFALGQQSGQRVNRVRWGDTKVYYPEGGVIAVAITSWDPETLEIQLAEIIFERSLEWATDGSADAYDVQALTAHESGHWLKLGDLYEDACSDETMYGYAELGETKKRTLGAGDVEGIDVIYGENLTGSESEYPQAIYGKPGLVRIQYDMTIEYVIIDGRQIYGKPALVEILYETET